MPAIDTHFGSDPSAIVRKRTRRPRSHRPKAAYAFRDNQRWLPSKWYPSLRRDCGAAADIRSLRVSSLALNAPTAVVCVYADPLLTVALSAIQRQVTKRFGHSSWQPLMDDHVTVQASISRPAVGGRPRRRVGKYRGNN